MTKRVSVKDAFFVNARRQLTSRNRVIYVPMSALNPWSREFHTFEFKTKPPSGPRFKNGDVLVARITPSLENGKTGWMSILPNNEVATGSTEFIVISSKDGVTDGLYGYYLARSPRFRAEMINSMTGTSGRQRVPVQAVKDYEFNCPPLAEQKRIAHILGSFDDKIELNRKMNETLEAMAQALFKDWFVDFGPTRAKMEGKEPYLAPELWELFPDKLGEDGVPEGWGERRLDEFFPVITGKKNANFADSEGIYPFFTCAIEQTLYTNSYSFDADAILLAGNGNFNVKWYRGKFEAYQRTYVLIPYKSQLLSILHALMQYFLNDLVVGHKGSVINYLTKGMITGYSITLPNDEVLCKFSPSFNKLYRLYERSLREGKALEAMRDALLNKIF